MEVLALILLIGGIGLLGVRMVPQGYNVVVERLGSFRSSLQPGLNFIIPLVDQVRARVSLMETVLNVPEQTVITRDNASVLADGVVFYQVLSAERSVYRVADLQLALLNLTMTNIRTVMGSMDLDELLSKRDDINAQLLRNVDAATEPWGVKVNRIELLRIEPPRDILEAMGRQMKAERDRRATILDADGDKEAKILRAQGELAAAKMQAEARERMAEAEANATRMVSEAVAKGDLQALNYFVAQKYVEALSAFANGPNQKTLILPTDMASIAGTLMGISALVSAPGGMADDPAAAPARAGGRRGAGELPPRPAA